MAFFNMEILIWINLYYAYCYILYAYINTLDKKERLNLNKARNFCPLGPAWTVQGLKIDLRIFTIQINVFYYDDFILKYYHFYILQYSRHYFSTS